MEKYAHTLAATPAKIDYFATSLPTMLLFEEDLASRQQTQAKLIERLALWGLWRQKNLSGVSSAISCATTPATEPPPICSFRCLGINLRVRKSRRADFFRRKSRAATEINFLQCSHWRLPSQCPRARTTAVTSAANATGPAKPVTGPIKIGFLVKDPHSNLV